MTIVNRPTKAVGGSGTSSWVAAQRIVASEFNAEADAIFNDHNGNITDANCAAGMALQGSKLASRPLGIPANKLNDGAINLVSMIADALITSGKLKLTLFNTWSIPNINTGNGASVNTTLSTALYIPVGIYANVNDINLTRLDSITFNFVKSVATSTWHISAFNSTGTNYIVAGGDAIEAYFLSTV